MYGPKLVQALVMRLAESLRYLDRACNDLEQFIQFDLHYVEWLDQHIASALHVVRAVELQSYVGEYSNVIIPRNLRVPQSCFFRVAIRIPMEHEAIRAEQCRFDHGDSCDFFFAGSFFGYRITMRVIWRPNLIVRIRTISISILH